VHTAEDYRTILGSAGYADVTAHPVPGLPAQIMVATRIAEATEGA
jgi:hypothetical protein